MNDDDLIDDQLSEVKDLTLSGISRDYLLQISKWTSFIAIVGFIVLVLVFFIAASVLFFLGSAIGMVGLLFKFIIYLVVFLFFFFPLFYLFQFSRKMKKALDTRSGAELQNALEHLNSHYKFLGILLAIGVGLYMLSFLFGGIAFVAH